MFIESLEITLFGMAIVFVMLLLIILAVKVIEPVRRFFAGLFKRDKGTEPEKEARPAPAIIAAIEAASGLNSRQFVLYSVRRRPARRNNNIF